MLAQTLDDGLTLHVLGIDEPPGPWRDTFAAAYCRIFAETPYEEHFTLEEAKATFTRLTTVPGHITLLVCDGDKVVGFGVAVPLPSDGTVARALQGLVPTKHTMYLVELGVDPAYQGRKLGKLMVRERIQRIDRDRYTHVVLRVAENRTNSVEMYRRLDFHDMGVSMDITRTRMDGTERTDTRHFMARVLSQVRVD